MLSLHFRDDAGMNDPNASLPDTATKEDGGLLPTTMRVKRRRVEILSASI
jgi:hypothetical protein